MAVLEFIDLDNRKVWVSPCEVEHIRVMQTHFSIVMGNKNIINVSKYIDSNMKVSGKSSDIFQDVKTKFEAENIVFGIYKALPLAFASGRVQNIYYNLEKLQLVKKYSTTVALVGDSGSVVTLPLSSSVNGNPQGTSTVTHPIFTDFQPTNLYNGLTIDGLTSQIDLCKVEFVRLGAATDTAVMKNGTTISYPKSATLPSLKAAATC